MGNAHHDSQNVNLLALLLEYGVQRGVQRIDSDGTLAFCGLVNIRPAIETASLEQAADSSALGKEGKKCVCHLNQTENEFQRSKQPLPGWRGERFP